MGRGDKRFVWRGLSVVDGRLVFRPKSPIWLRGSLRFEPEGLVLVSRSGQTETLPWDGYGSQWEFQSQGGTRGSRAGILVYFYEGTRQWLAGSRQVFFPCSWHAAPFEEFPALGAYLCSTPLARDGLADLDRLRRLLAGLDAETWKHPKHPREPMAGKKLDRSVAVSRAIARSGWRMIDGHPVRGEPKPDADELVSAARSLLPPAARDHVCDDDLRHDVDGWLAMGAWPFGALLDA